MENLIDTIITSKNIVLYGISRNKNKFGNVLYKELTSKGYNIFPIHAEPEVNGVKCYSSLKDILVPIEAAVINISSNNVIEVLDNLKEAGVKNIWLQKGSESLDVIKHIYELELNAVTKKCILMYAQPVQSIHKVHRVIKSIFGGL